MVQSDDATEPWPDHEAPVRRVEVGLVRHQPDIDVHACPAPAARAQIKIFLGVLPEKARLVNVITINVNFT